MIAMAYTWQAKSRPKTDLSTIDGRWMTCDFTSFSTVFQSYHNNRCKIIELSAMELFRRGSYPGPLDQYTERNI